MKTIIYSLYIDIENSCKVIFSCRFSSSNVGYSGTANQNINSSCFFGHFLNSIANLSAGL